MRIFLIGFMGSGKTHWGKQLAEKLLMPLFDLDRVIVETEQQTIADIFAVNGEEYFRNKEKLLLEELVAANESCIISCGGGTPCFFNNIDFMKDKGTVVWLNTDINTLISRLIKEKHHRPLIKDIPDDDLKAFVLKKIQGRKLYYEQANIIVSEESLTIDKFAKILLDA